MSKRAASSTRSWRSSAARRTSRAGPESGIDLGSVLEAEWRERSLGAGTVGARDHEVEVAVGAGLLAEERIDAPRRI